MTLFIEDILAFLRIRTAAAGLEVSDQVVRLAYVRGKAWQLHAVRLAPGVLADGKIRDRARFVAALTALKEKVFGRGKKKTMNVVVCMSSVPAYTQVFSLPAAEGKEFAESVELNVKMASPMEADKAYADWQLLGRDETTFQNQVLAAFVERAAVDDMVDALFDAGFLAMAMESRALALTRVLREKAAGVDAAKPLIFVSIDNSGLEFLIIRNGALYFEYVEPWRDVADEKGEVPVDKFKEAFAASVRQVVNYYRQHWQEPLGAVIISAVALEAEAEEAAAAAADAPVVRLTLVMGQPISPEWLAALGCSLRSEGVRKKAHEVSLLGEASQDRFREGQLIGFMRFWRVVVPVVFGLLLVTFGVADAFLVSTKQAVESRSDFNLGAAQQAEISSLTASADEFNQLVMLVTAAEQAMSPKSDLLTALTGIAAAHGVTVDHVTFQSFTNPVALAGSAPSQDNVVAFEAALTADPRFSAVELPLTGVQSSGSSISFSMTFLYTSPAGASQ